MVRSRLAFIKHLILAIGSLGLCICGTELGLHVYDSWAECAVCRADKSACAPSWTVHHSLKPDLRITVTDPDLGTEVRWRTNSLGLRGPEVEVPKPPGTFRIVCLGDESTLAPETAQAETFAARIKELLPVPSAVNLEVINAGCPQTGPLLSYLSLRHRLLALAPDLVVFNFDMADVADDHRCRRHVRMNGKQPLYCPHPELERQRTASEVFWVERLLLWQHGKRGVGHLLGADDQAEDARDIDAPQGAYAWLRDDAPDWSVYIDQTLDILSQMAVACRQANAEFVLSVIPCPWQVTAEASNGAGVRERAGLQQHVLYKNRLPFDSLSAFAERENILYCDPSPAFRGTEHAERLFRENAPRFSAAGHDLYARVLERFLVTNVVGPWRANGRMPDRRMSSRDSSDVRRSELGRTDTRRSEVRRADARDDREPVSPAEFDK
jgi:hypothetical protein